MASLKYLSGSILMLFVVMQAQEAYPLDPELFGKLDSFAKQTLEKRPNAVGYPVNQNTQLDAFYRWYVDKGLYRAALNNVGNPFEDPPYGMNTHDYEREVVDFFAARFGFKENDYWGFVTASGTDGNNHGLYYGRKVLQSKSQSQPIIYVSKEAHYSIKKLADVQNTELRIIKTHVMGQMSMEDFERQLDPNRPALISVSMGTTFLGAIDDQAAIRKILRKKKVPAYFIHLDAALFGGYLPFSNEEEGRNLVNQQVQQFDSIAVSGHKFFGFDEPTGAFLITKEGFDNINPFRVEYLKGVVPTITCSRSAISPLKFWWKIKSTSLAEFEKQARTMLHNAKYLKDQLEKIGVKAWLNPHSNTVFFERPPEDIMSRYNLAPDESKELGKLAHVLVMQHVSKELIDQFIKDYKTKKSAS